MRNPALGLSIALGAFLAVPVEASAQTCPKGVVKAGCPAPAAAPRPAYAAPRTITPDGSYGAPFAILPFGYSPAPVFRPPYSPYGGPYGYSVPF